MMRMMIIGLSALAVFWLAAFVLFIQSIPRNPVGDSISTQAIVVLTGGSLRISYGFELLEKKKAKKLFISGVGKDLTVEQLLESNQATARMRDLAKHKGALVLGYKADSTRGNAEETAQWMQQEGYKSLRLVTANYHLPRSMMEFRRAMPHLIIIPDPVFPGRFRMEGSWWQDGVTRSLVFSEFHKYLMAWCLGAVT